MLAKNTLITVTSYQTETLAKFSSLSSQDLIKAYMEVQSDPEFNKQQAAPAAEITDITDQSDQELSRR